MTPIGIDIVGSGISVPEKHEFYKIIQHNWICWRALHNRVHTGTNLLYNISCELYVEPANVKSIFIWSPDHNAAGQDFWCNVWDDIAAHCRAYIDGASHRQHDLSIIPDGLDNGIDFSLARKGPEVGDQKDYFLTNLSVSTPQLSLTIIDIPRRELRRLAQFLTEYADEVDSDAAEHEYDI